MKDPNEIFRLIRPILKRWYIVLLCFVLGLWLAYKGSNYRNAVYEATTVIKLDNMKHGISDLSLYENFDLFSAQNKTANEVELIMSKGLIIKTLKKLDFNQAYYRIGKLKKLELYKDKPFEVVVQHIDSTLCDKPFSLISYDSKNFLLTFTHDGIAQKIEGTFGKPIYLPYFKGNIKVNPEVITSKAKDFLLEGKFEFYLHTYEYLAAKFDHEHFFVRSPGKEMDIIYLSYKHEIPKKAMVFVNAHAKTYIEDGVKFKEMAAKNTVDFINRELDEMNNTLLNSEREIEIFKRENRIVNPKQETQAKIDKLSHLELEKIRFLSKNEALDKIYTHLEKNPDKAFISPNYESILDPLFIDRLSSFNNLKLERQEKRLKYKKSNPIILALDEKIAALQGQIFESIQNNKTVAQEELARLDKEIADVMLAFSAFPEKERRLIDLDRHFRLHEKMYSFLSEKKIEAELMGKAGISFHRIISDAELPTTSITPGRSFVMIVVGALSLIIGVFIVYALDYFNPVVCSWHELEGLTTLPVIGEVPYFSKEVNSMAFSTIATSLMLKRKITKGTHISISSSIPNEGKSFFAYNFARAAANMGWKVLIIDFDLIKPSLHRLFHIDNTNGVRQFLKGKCDIQSIIQPTDIGNLDFVAAEYTDNETTFPIIQNIDDKLLDELSSTYDLVVFDTSPAGMVIDAVPVMAHCNLNLYLIKANSTNRKLLYTPSLIMQEYGINNIEMVLNGTKNESSYTGYYPRAGYGYGLSNSLFELGRQMVKKWISRAS